MQAGRASALDPYEQDEARRKEPGPWPARQTWMTGTRRHAKRRTIGRFKLRGRGSCERASQVSLFPKRR